MKIRELKPLLYKSAYEILMTSQSLLEILRKNTEPDISSLKSSIETIVKNAEHLREALSELE